MQGSSMAVFRASKQSQLLQLRGMATIKEKVGALGFRFDRLVRDSALPIRNVLMANGWGTLTA